MEDLARPWYKKKRYIFGIIGAIAILTSGSSQDTYVQPSSYVAPKTTVEERNTPNVNVLAPTTNTSPSTDSSVEAYSNSELSNDNYYTNTAGNKVHSPAYSESIPIGATAQCRDWTYSFSQSRRGTCSHHGGVAEWL